LYARDKVRVERQTPARTLCDSAPFLFLPLSAFPFSPAVLSDQNGNAWLTGSTYIYKISGSGTVSPFQPDEGSAYYDIAIDGSGNVWTNSTSGTPSLVELSPSGTDLHFASAASIGDRAIAIDASGTVWTSGIHSVLFGTSIATGTNVNVTASNTGYTGLAIDSAGDILAMYASPGGLPSLTPFTYNSSTNAYSPVSNSAGGSSSRPLGLTIDGSNTVWLASTYPFPSVNAYSNSGSLVCSYMYNPNGAYNTYPWASPRTRQATFG
jgi:streptogramin lyase